MRSFIWKVAGLLILLLTVLVGNRIYEVNKNAGYTELLVGTDESIVYDDMVFYLDNVCAYKSENNYKVFFEFKIFNGTSEEKKINCSQISLFSGAIHNGVTTDDVMRSSVVIKPGETITSEYNSSFIKDNISDAAWGEIESRKFKIVLIEYGKESGWETDPIENNHLIDEENNKEIESGIKWLEKEEFFATQMCNIGESVDCYWSRGYGYEETLVNVQVKDIDITSTVSDGWSYVFSNIDQYSMRYTPLISKIETKDNKITNGYSAATVFFRLECENAIILRASDLELSCLNERLYYEDSVVRYLSNNGIFNNPKELVFVKVDPEKGIIYPETTSNTIELHPGVNEIAITYLLAEDAASLPAQLYIEKSFITIGKNSKLNQCYKNDSLLIHLVE